MPAKMVRLVLKALLVLLALMANVVLPVRLELAASRYLLCNLNKDRQKWK